jgi:hypothetical protein
MRLVPDPDVAARLHRTGITAYLLVGTHDAVYLSRLIGGARPFWVWCNYWPERVGHD